MSALTPSKVEQYSRGKWFRETSPALIEQIHFDSREIREGDCFVALKTGKRDGHEFVRIAAEAGAKSAIVDKPDETSPIAQLVVNDTLAALQDIATGMRRDFDGTVIGITGSCGKTSTKELLALLLGKRVLHTEGNLNNYIGMPLTLTRLDSARHNKAVIEVGISRTGEMPPLAKILSPTFAIVTSVAPAHLEGLGSIEGVAAEKAALPETMGANGHAFFPSYCLNWTPFRQLGAKCIPTIEVGEKENLNADADPNFARYQVTKPEPNTLMMRLLMPGSKNAAIFTLPKISRGMRSNAALALALALDLGYSEEILHSRLADWTPAKMRGEIRRIGQTSYYVDCYNANPASMNDAIANFRDAFPTVSKLYMIGCMNELGKDSEQIHEKLGRTIECHNNEQFCIYGNESESLRAGLIAAGAAENNVAVIKTKDEGFAIINNFKQQNGAVFLKGSHSYHMEDFVPSNQP